MTATRLTNPRGTTRQGLAATSRRDPWWLVPGIIAAGFGAFIVYSLFSALIWEPLFGVPYEVDGYLSPFFSPLIVAEGTLPAWFSPAILILWIPLGLRASCYYYRKAYYRSYFADPPACAVGEPTIHRRYAMERAFPFILQNVHRYFLYLAFIPLFFLWIDGFYSFVNTGPRLGLGSLILLGNAALLTAFSLSCHSLRHLAGGRLDCFSCGVAARVRYRAWQRLTGLNEGHMVWAWVSLVSVALADLYVRLLAAGVIVDPAIRL